MILEIDAGNSRLKWRILDTGKPSSHGVQGQATALVQSEGDLPAFLNNLQSQPMTEVSRVRVASVRGDVFNKELAACLADQWQLSPEFATVEKHCAGVSNSYADITTMGIDRWLAMLAAFNKAGGACCVLDFGSAATFERIDDNGMHLGGYIVPGLQLMRDSLANKAPALNIGAVDWGSTAPGSSTGSAISGGILAMAAGFANYCYQQTGSNDAVHWFLTGGDARLLSPLLSWQHRVEPDLVLDGLGLCLP